MSHQSILTINSSGRFEGSVTRQLVDRITTEIEQSATQSTVHQRDLATGLPFIDQQWIAANFTDPAERTEAHLETLNFSNELVNELQRADTLVIGVPIYNFSIPAVLKAWIDLIARAKLTFRYTQDGPEGLLSGKKVYLAMASGGVPIGSEADFASRYLLQVLAFVGLTDVTIVDASKVDFDSENLLDDLTEEITHD